MDNRHAYSSAFIASLAGAALMSGAVCAQTAKPAPAAKATASVIVVVTNQHDVALTELDATPSGLFLPKTIVSNLPAGKSTSVRVATDKDCVYDLHGLYADGSSTDSTSVDLCKDKNVNLLP